MCCLVGAYSVLLGFSLLRAQSQEVLPHVGLKWPMEKNWMKVGTRVMISMLLRLWNLYIAYCLEQSQTYKVIWGMMAWQCHQSKLLWFVRSRESLILRCCVVWLRHIVATPVFSPLQVIAGGKRNLFHDYNEFLQYYISCKMYFK